MSAGPAPLVPAPPSFGARGLAFLRRHPVVCLAALTPGIPEYLSGSSSPAVLALNPPIFVLLLALNLGMYTGGVLLIREARVRWHLGLAGVLTLGLAYGILEEGFALTTLFDPNNGNVSPATAGAWGGVNWGWTSGILPFHAIFSVAIPLFLFDRAFPELRERSLLAGWHRGLAAGLYLLTIGLLSGLFAVRVYWMGWPVFLGGLASVAALVCLARALPRDALSLPARPPAGTPRRWFVLGFSAFPLLLIVPGLLATLHPPLPVLVVLAPSLWGAYLVVIVPRLGAIGGERAAVALVAGLVAPLFVSGAIVGVIRDPYGLPAVAATELLAGWFLWWLYRTASQGADPGPAPPPGEPRPDLLGSRSGAPTPPFPVELPVPRGYVHPSGTGSTASRSRIDLRSDGISFFAARS